MNFDYSDEQRALHESLTRWLDKHYTFAQRRERLQAARPADDATWHTLAEMGLLALPLPEAHGGLDGGSVDVAGVMAILGAKLVLEPYLPTVLAARLLADTGTPAQCDRWLPEVAQGRLRLALGAWRTRLAPCAHPRGHHRRARWRRLAARRAARRWWSARRRRRCWWCRRACRAPSTPARGWPCSSSTRQAPRCRAAQLSQPRRAAGRRCAAARRACARCAAAGRGRRGGGGDRAHARPRRGGGVRRSVGRDARAERHHAGVPEDAQAVRRRDRQLPGAAAPHGRHGGGHRAGRIRWR